MKRLRIADCGVRNVECRTTSFGSLQSLMSLFRAIAWLS